MRGDLLQQAAAASVLFDQHPQRDAVQRLAGTREKQQLAAARVELWAGFVEVALDRLSSRLAERDDPFLVSLPQHADAADLEVHVAQLHAAQLAGAQAAGVEQLEDRDVALEQRRAGVGGRKEPSHLVLAEDLGQRPLGLGAFELLEDVRNVVPLTGAEAEEDAD